jgi:pre-mRNA-splicing factor SPF27
MSDQETLLLDALPYVDKDLEVHPNLQALVDAEIAKETRRFKPTPIDSDPRIPPDITLFAVSTRFLRSFFTISLI